MKKIVAMSLLRGMLMPLSVSGQNKIFPYKYSMGDLPNGLRVVTIPTDYPNIVALYIVVNTGSRNEIEPGRSGFAHRSSTSCSRDREALGQQYNELLKVGADTNAYNEPRPHGLSHRLFQKRP